MIALIPLGLLVIADMAILIIARRQRKTDPAWKAMEELGMLYNAPSVWRAIAGGLWSCFGLRATKGWLKR